MSVSRGPKGTRSALWCLLCAWACLGLGCDDDGAEEPSEMGPPGDEVPGGGPPGGDLPSDEGDHICYFHDDTGDCFDQYGKAEGNTYPVVMVHDDWVGPGVGTGDWRPWGRDVEMYFPVGVRPGFDPIRPGLNVSAVQARCGDEVLRPKRVSREGALRSPCLPADEASEGETCAEARFADLAPLRDPDAWTAEPAPAVALGLRGGLALTFERDLRGCQLEVRLPDDLAHLPGTGVVTLCTDTYGLHCVPHQTGEPIRTIDGTQNPAVVPLPAYGARDLEGLADAHMSKLELDQSGDFSRVRLSFTPWWHDWNSGVEQMRGSVPVCGVRVRCGGTAVAPQSLHLDWSWKSPCPPSYGQPDTPCEPAHLDAAFLLTLQDDDATCADLPAAPYPIVDEGAVHLRFDRDLRGCEVQVLLPEGDAEAPLNLGLTVEGGSSGLFQRGPWIDPEAAQPPTPSSSAWHTFSILAPELP